MMIGIILVFVSSLNLLAYSKRTLSSSISISQPDKDDKNISNFQNSPKLSVSRHQIVKDVLSVLKSRLDDLYSLYLSYRGSCDIDDLILPVSFCFLHCIGPFSDNMIKQVIFVFDYSYEQCLSYIF